MPLFGKNSITETSEQQITNSIVQISNAKCLNICINGAQITATIVNSTGIDIDIEQSCIVSGTSCVIRASLDASILNTLSNLQSGQIKAEEDPTNFLNGLTDIGNVDDITLANYQAISNEITQELNSICNNSSINIGKPITINFTNVKDGHFYVNQDKKTSNTQCNITNTAKVVLTNQASNSQTASIVRTGMFGGLGAIVIIIIAYMYMQHKKKHNKEMCEMVAATQVMASAQAKEASAAVKK